MALLKFFEGKESSYSSSSHSGGLYFAKDTGVILFKGVKYGSKPDLSNYATKSDISSLRSELGNKADSNHEHTIDDISDLIIATRVQSGLMSAVDKRKLDSLPNHLEISPASLIGSDRYDILKGITDKHIGVNAQFTDGKLTIGLYDFNKSEWVGAPSVTIPLQ